MYRSTLALLSGGALLTLSACATSVPEPSSPATPAAAGRATGEQTITPGDMQARIAFLASDALRGRDTPSPGLDAAAAYLVGEYLRLGLEPAGENGSYYQRYPFGLRRLGMENASVRVSGPRGTQTLVAGRDFFATGATVGALEAGLVLAGRDLRPETDSGAGLQGQVALALLPGAPGSRPWRTLRGQQSGAAQRAGARAVVHVLGPEWTEAQIAEAARSAAAPARVLGERSAFPQLFLSYPVARRLLADSGVELDAVWRAPAGVEQEPVRLAPLTLTLHLPEERLDQATAPNVVAVLPGSDPQLRDEYVILSAHMDHVGVGRPVRGDSIYNGADDNASGTAALVEVAEALASLPAADRPRRSVIFLHVSGEEHGLLGSRWYSDHPTVPLAQVVANINVDMIGRNASDSVVVIGKDYSSLGAVVNRVGVRNPSLGLVVSDDLWPEERFFFRSDHFNFARKEIPALFFFTGVHEDYHRPSDEVEKLNLGKAARVARLILHTARAIADDPERPRWDPKGLQEVRSLTR